MIIKENIETKVNDPRAVAEILRSILKIEPEEDQDKEHVWVIGLTACNTVKYVELCTLGLVNECLIHAREVFRLAVTKGVTSVIIAHNHPSGNVNPSEQDRINTEKLIKAGEIIDIKVLDHVIIAGQSDFSMKEKNTCLFF